MDKNTHHLDRRHKAEYKVEKQAAGEAMSAALRNQDILAPITLEQPLHAQRRQQSFAIDILNSVDANIAVLDAQGIIIAVNKNWRHFAEENVAEGSPAARNTDIGTDYLQVCRQACRAGVESAQIALDGIVEVLAGHVPQFRFEYPCHSPTVAHWYEMSVSPMSRIQGGVVVLHTEITDRKLAELALTASADRLSATLDSTRDGILALAASGEVLFMNRRFRQMWNLPDHLANDVSDEQLLNYAKTQLPDPQAFLEKVEAIRQAKDESDDRIELIDGRVFERHFESLRSEGQTVGRVWSFHDITEQLQANRAKSAFLSSMSHELRTPLNAILGFAQILEYDDNLDADQKEDVLEILKAGDHLLELINAVLDLSTLESGRIELKLEPVEICPVVEECLAMIQPLAHKRNIRIHHSVLEQTRVQADRTRLKQVLLNLLSNATKYNVEGGQIRLDAVANHQDRLRILVSDTGKGLSREQLNSLFQPFNRLGAESSGVEGTGIGLTISRRIMEMMGGSIDVESEVGVGSTFWLELAR